MATAPDDSRRHQAEAVAIALLSGTRYSLPTIIRSTKVNPRLFRRIAATEALRSNVAAPYFDLVRAWAVERDGLMSAYADARASGDAIAMRAALDRAAVNVESHLSAFQNRFPAAFASMDRWHRVQWIARIRAATSIDVSMFTTSAETSVEVRNAVARNDQLLAAVHEEIKGRAGSLLLNSLTALVPVAAVTVALNDVTARAKARSARIALDQVETLLSGMNTARRRAAGLARFRWHHTPQPHPRKEHLARDLRVYSDANAPNDRVGTLPYCRCWEEPLFD